MFLTNLSLCKNIVTKKSMQSFSAPTMKFLISFFFAKPNRLNKKMLLFFPKKGNLNFSFQQIEH